jgi:hypothetical protein
MATEEKTAVREVQTWRHLTTLTEPFYNDSPAVDTLKPGLADSALGAMAVEGYAPIGEPTFRLDRVIIPTLDEFGQEVYGTLCVTIRCIKNP